MSKSIKKVNKILIFEIKAPFAYFRVPRTTRMILSYPFPPKTAVMGLLAGIIGLKRNKYWSNDHEFSKIKISIEILKVSNFSSFRMNYEQTKHDFSGIKHYSRDPFRLIKTIDTSRRGFTTRQKLLVARDVHYRIYCKFPENSKYYNLLQTALKNHNYVYPPYLGNVNFFCELEYVGSYNFNRLSNENSHRIDSLIPTKYVVPDDEKLRYGGFELYFNVPTNYYVEKKQLKGKRKKFKIPGINYWKIIDVDYIDFIYHLSEDHIDIKLKKDKPVYVVKELEKNVAFV